MARGPPTPLLSDLVVYVNDSPSLINLSCTSKKIKALLDVDRPLISYLTGALSTLSYKISETNFTVFNTPFLTKVMIGTTVRFVGKTGKGGQIPVGKWLMDFKNNNHLVGRPPVVEYFQSTLNFNEYGMLDGIFGTLRYGPVVVVNGRINCTKKINIGNLYRIQVKLIEDKIAEIKDIKGELVFTIAPHSIGIKNGGRTTNVYFGERTRGIQLLDVLVSSFQ